MKTLPPDLFAAAKNGRERAYSPYSHWKVGAAIRTKKGSIFEGCNIENSSYGATICAERSAIAHAVSREGDLEITEVVVVTDATPAWPPCGICRQVLAEFGANATVYMTNLQGQSRSLTMRELLPETFTPDHLKK